MNSFGRLARQGFAAQRIQKLTSDKDVFGLLSAECSSEEALTLESQLS